VTPVQLTELLCSLVEAASAGRSQRVPEAAQFLWSTFKELHARRRTGLGPEPISPSDLQAWVTLSRTPLAPHHVDILLAMDAAWVAAPLQGDSAPPSVNRSSGQPLTAAAFDAVFG
jgi:hypothetical protein